MPNKNYRKGYNFERKLVNELRDIPGCVFAARTAGSHSPFDVVAIIDNSLFLIQCKTGKTAQTSAKDVFFPDIPHILEVNKLVATPLGFILH